MKCPNCGSEISEGIKFCVNCGANLAEVSQTSASQPVSDTVPATGSSDTAPQDPLNMGSVPEPGTISSGDLVTPDTNAAAAPAWDSSKTYANASSGQSYAPQPDAANAASSASQSYAPQPGSANVNASASQGYAPQPDAVNAASSASQGYAPQPGSANANASASQGYAPQPDAMNRSAGSAQYNSPQYGSVNAAGAAAAMGYSGAQAADNMDYSPISMWGYLGYEILFAIPTVGFICMLVFSFGGTRNINVRNFARSYLCATLIVFILIVLFFILIFAIAGSSALSESWN
ncbi:MAG: zinc-ribbon domain-containing protein [Lachnospiraceae bacterium]|nr:zinc-ribbon domain-containing protein [Lachnospiraceae bacterium]